MQATGYLQVRTYTSSAQLPLADTAVAVTGPDGAIIALRLTDSSGKIEPVAVPVPEKAESQDPNPPETPYATVNLYARKEGYEQIEAEHVQLFADTTTVQALEMIPLAELPDSRNQFEIFDTPPQNL